jgi:hypothetical protein
MKNTKITLAGWDAIEERLKEIIATEPTLPRIIETTIAAAAERFGVTPKTIHEWCQKGILNKKQRGKYKRIIVEIPENLKIGKLSTNEQN